MMIRFILAWIRRFGVPARPVWLVRWMHNRLYQHNVRHVVPLLVAAHAKHPDTGVTWAAAGTSHEEIVAWFDTTVGEAVRPTLAPLDVFRVGVVHCDEAAWECADTTIDVSSTDMLVDWVGHREEWHTEGRAVVAQALPAQHNGLCVIVVGAGTAVRTVLEHGVV